MVEVESESFIASQSVLIWTMFMNIDHLRPAQPGLCLVLFCAI